MPEPSPVCNPQLEKQAQANESNPFILPRLSGSPPTGTDRSRQCNHQRTGDRLRRTPHRQLFTLLANTVVRRCSPRHDKCRRTLHGAPSPWEIPKHGRFAHGYLSAHPKRFDPAGRRPTARILGMGFHCRPRHYARHPLPPHGSLRPARVPHPRRHALLSDIRPPHEPDPFPTDGSG